MIGRVLVLVFALGCGGSSAQEEKSCEHAIKLCGYDEGPDSCIKDIRETKEAMGENYGKFLECSGAAKTCGEYIGCAAGGIGAEGMKQLEGLQRGMEKMMGDPMRDATRRMHDSLGGGGDTVRDATRRMHDRLGGGGGPTTAPECKRADDVCSPTDATLAAFRCTSSIGNVKADPENRAKFVSCLAVAKNCYAFNDCASQLFFDLH